MNNAITIKFDDKTRNAPAPHSEFHANAELFQMTYMFSILCQRCNGQKCECCEWTGAEVLGVKFGKMDITNQYKNAESKERQAERIAILKNENNVP